MLGAAAFSMSGIKALRAISENDFGVRTSIEQVMRMMVPFLAAGMRADSGIDDNTWQRRTDRAAQRRNIPAKAGYKPAG